MSYGFRIFKIKFTPDRKLAPDLHFDNPLFGPDGARGAVASACTKLHQSSGDADTKKGAYFKVVEAQEGGWMIAVLGSGGSFGIQRDVIDTTTGQYKAPIAPDDAVLDRMHLLLLIPPNGDSGLLVAETSGRSHLTPGLTRALNLHLKGRGVKLRLEDDFTDAEAWSQFLDQSNIDVKAVELVQTHKPAQGVSFGDKSIARAVVTLQLAKGAQAKSGLLKELKKAHKKGSKPQLTGLIGLQAAADDDFDEQRVVYVQNGRQRRITVASSWPAFIYELGDTPPSRQELLDGCRSEVQHLLTQMQIGRPNDWWPTGANMKAL
ncbi:hypothetical protein [Nocardioides sp. P86]|uniref:hypothetical protein n=1 Tax=Nocardioides sp. P86 TaxID=2939569 RepID=UPI00203F78A0|nr:hypothetical protein [Nocardioides sp. P86]MCM3516240.1 hypothetical protein [Nocardioides sp. P86]